MRYAPLFAALLGLLNYQGCARTNTPPRIANNHVDSPVTVTPQMADDLSTHSPGPQGFATEMPPGYVPDLQLSTPHSPAQVSLPSGATRLATNLPQPSQHGPLNHLPLNLHPLPPGLNLPGAPLGGPQGHPPLLPQFNSPPNEVGPLGISTGQIPHPNHETLQLALPPAPAGIEAWKAAQRAIQSTPGAGRNVAENSAAISSEGE